jgi:AcrR family transcriptional regulator
MQDVFAESGLSAGAVYRYFRSKSDIITAIIGDSGLLLESMEEVLHEDPPTLDDVLGRLAEMIVSWSGETDAETTRRGVRALMEHSAG